MKLEILTEEIIRKKHHIDPPQEWIDEVLANYKYYDSEKEELWVYSEKYLKDKNLI